MQRILGIVGWIGTALVFGAVAVRLLGGAGAITLTQQVDQYAVYAAWAGLACVVLYTLGQWREIIGYFRGRNARYGALASVSVLVMLGILVAVNYLSARRNKRWDLTANQQFTLSDQTIKLLQGLQAPVKFMVFDQEVNFDRFRARLDEYDYQSDQVSVEYIDADKRPVQARQYNVESYGTVVIEYNGRTERVTSDAEQDLTNGLIKVITGAQKKVYFVQGHGEKNTTDTERTGYSSITGALGRDNYGVEPLVLAQQQDVPADASVVVVAGPRSDLLQGEADMLRRYLNKGGHLLVLFDPPEADDSPTPILTALLQEWAVEVGDNVVVDVSGMGQLLGTDASVPVAAQYSAHPITDGFNMITAYPLARSIAGVTGGVNGRTAQTIIETSPRSWAETNVQQLRTSGEVQLNADAGDKPGPVSIGVAVAAPAPDAPAPAAAPASDGSANPDTPPTPEARVAVIGDSDFASNFALGIQGNRDLFMNAVNWLAQQENLIAIRPRAADDRRITLTAASTRVLMWMSLLVVPGLVFGAGVYTWSRRR
jgi:ABC-type uncharacterized transport system involved in gliding motility auxiliary subunit